MEDEDSPAVGVVAEGLFEPLGLFWCDTIGVEGNHSQALIVGEVGCFLVTCGTVVGKCEGGLPMLGECLRAIDAAVFVVARSGKTGQGVADERHRTMPLAPLRIVVPIVDEVSGMDKKAGVWGVAERGLKHVSAMVGDVVLGVSEV